jgi:hypothetical protein
MTDTFTPPTPLQTAVLFLVFNRPDTTAQVFAAIRQAKPPRLYVAADGAREWYEGEADKVAKVREIATTVDWPCEVKTLFREENLGCKTAVSGAITWFFEHEEQGIILEDDCVPHPDFFCFCNELLNYYADDERVSVITGNNFQNGRRRGDAAYYFSKYPHCWGWATWRRVWELYRGNIPFWSEWKTSADWRKKNVNKHEWQYWNGIFDRVHAGKIDSWAYPWAASLWYHGGLTATPNVNLVSNIGFGSESTHTTSTDSPLAAMATKAIGELRHPFMIVQDFTADRYVFNYHFGGKKLSWLRLLKRVFNKEYRRFKIWVNLFLIRKGKIK